MKAALEKKLVFATAFCEGLCVLVVEIAGARALAPYYGSSLRVWTSQITATLLFLALGYGLGGRLSRKAGNWKLGLSFWVAGLWLALYPFLRTGVLSFTSAHAGVAGGSLLSAALLFGLPLLCLGAVSPLLIARLGAIEAGAGQAAGSLFFVNTLGGLAGGWLTALVLIPHLPLRLSLAGCGIFLALLGSFWGLLLRPKSKASAIAAPLTALALVFMSPSPSLSLDLGGIASKVDYRQSSGVGLIEVIDVGPYGRSLMIDGVTQGGMSKETGTSVYEFTEYLNFLSHRYHPHAKSALLLGLGSGLLAKQLVLRGLSVTAAEVEPTMEAVARDWFDMPAAVRVIPEDGRAWLNRTDEKYDLVFLDAFAGENAPWYLTTKEAMAQIKRCLNPGGRLLINSVARPQGSEGLKRLEANIMEAFGEGLVFLEAPHDAQKSDLINATLLAGVALKVSTEKFPSKVFQRIEPKLMELTEHVRPAVASNLVMTDDACDLDYAESPLRLEWRKLVIEVLGPKILTD